MSTYAKITDFAAKDALLTGNPTKLVKGVEIGAEFDSIATADASNVKGPTSAVTDNAVVRWDTTTGRIAQGSGVTIDDSNIVTASGFSGPHNGTVGATTPSTGAFTTLSASGNTTLNADLQVKGTSTATNAPIYLTATDTVSEIHASSSSGVAKTLKLFGSGGGSSSLDITGSAVTSNVPLSVTGALSSTSTATVATGSSSATAGNLFINNDSGNRIAFTAYGSAYAGGSAFSVGPNGALMESLSGSFGVNVPTGKTLYLGVNYSGIAAVSATGLSVTGTLSSTGALTAGSSGAAGIFKTSGTLSTTGVNYLSFQDTTERGYVGFGVGDSSFAISNSVGAIKLNTNGATQATLDTNGNWGLGVVPSAWGASYKSIDLPYGSVSSTSNAALLLQNAYFNGSAWTYKATAAAAAYSVSSGAHSWSIAPSGTAGNAITFTTAMTLDGSGNLLVGVTSTSATPAQGVTLQNTSGTVGNIGIGHANGTASGNAYASFAYNSVAIGSITQSGTTAVLYNTTSDQRLKDNIVDAPEFGSVIDAIQVRSFDWKADGTHQRAGFVAQELALVAPEAVHQPTNPDDMMAVDYSKLVPLLVKEIQSLRARLNAAGIA